MTVRVQRWGNSLGVRVPKEIARRAAIHEGAELEVLLKAGKVILQPLKVPSLKQLLAEAVPKNQPALVEWGAKVGREAW
jgi:antitoxin MazE